MDNVLLPSYLLLLLVIDMQPVPAPVENTNYRICLLFTAPQSGAKWTVQAVFCFNQLALEEIQTTQ